MHVKYEFAENLHRTVILGSEATPESNLGKDSGQALRLCSGQLKGSEFNRTARMTNDGLF